MDTMRTQKSSSKKKKSAAFLAAGVIGLATAGGAYAYWTSLGGGTGTASTRAGAGNIFLVTGGSATAMYPGDVAQTVTATVKNTGTESYKIQAVKAYVRTNKANCDGSDYRLNGAEAPVSEATAASLAVTPVSLAPAATTTVDYTLQFNDKTTNQDACKGATVTINYVAS